MIVNNLQLYQRSKSFIWTDEHISKNMLAAHLDLDSDTASRNISTIKKTVEWISGVSKENAKILDIGCGPGLYSVVAATCIIINNINLIKKSVLVKLEPEKIYNREG